MSENWFRLLVAIYRVVLQRVHTRTKYSKIRPIHNQLFDLKRDYASIFVHVRSVRCQISSKKRQIKTDYKKQLNEVQPRIKFRRFHFFALSPSDHVFAVNN